jgi:hypothetical protein
MATDSPYDRMSTAKQLRYKIGFVMNLPEIVTDDDGHKKRILMDYCCKMKAGSEILNTDACRRSSKKVFDHYYTSTCYF